MPKSICQKPRNVKEGELLLQEKGGYSGESNGSLSRKQDQEARRIDLRKNFCWLSDAALLESVPILTFPRDSLFLASCDWSSISSGTSRSTFYLSGFGKRNWILWLSNWDDQGETSTKKIPIAGVSCSDVADSKDACEVLLSRYIASLDYEFSPDYIEGGELMSEDQLAEIIYEEES